MQIIENFNQPVYSAFPALFTIWLMIWLMILLMILLLSRFRVSFLCGEGSVSG
ncbi:MAG: hypothetical protein GXP01_01420 [Alphaproteobacteria bacterium]|nr:hypothetical protein [Alphaproteobacteria bacterium]